MVTISLCMIIKNEEEVIGRCLSTVHEFVDEIIIVDTGSSDKSKEIVKQYTDKIIDFKWIDDFSAARNASFSQATMDYIMWLDADDILLESDVNAFMKLKEELDPSIDMVMMKYNVAFDEEGNPTLSYFRERLMKRSMNYQWVSPIHEVITPLGNIEYSNIAITHKKMKSSDSNRNLDIFRKMIEKGMPFDARQQFYYARELYYHQFYQDAINEFHNFLDNEFGWVENKINACVDLANCCKAMNQPKKQLEALFHSFQYDLPRAEICCELGNYFLMDNQLKLAIFWYQQATNCHKNE